MKLYLRAARFRVPEDPKWFAQLKFYSAICEYCVRQPKFPSCPRAFIETKDHYYSATCSGMKAGLRPVISLFWPWLGKRLFRWFGVS